MPDHLWMGQFNIIRGEVREEGPFVGVFVAPADAETSADLYVLAEPALPGSESYCDQLVAVLGQLFHSSDLSITGNLQRALRSAHDSLRDWNRKSLPEHWIASGVACLAVSGTQGYVASMGPTAVFVRTGDHTRRVEPVLQASLEPMGSSEQFHPHFARVALNPGDVVLLVSSGINRLADDAMMATILARAPEDILPELYLLARREENFAALVVAYRAAEAPEEQETPPAVPAEAPGPAEAAPSPDEAAPEPPLPEPAAEETEVQATPAAEGSQAGREREEPGAGTPAPRFDAGAFAARLPDPRERPERPVVDIHHRAEPARETAGLASAVGMSRSSVRRPLPKRYPSLGGRRLGIPLRAVIIIAAALGLLALTWLALPGLLAESKADRYDTLVRRAEAAYQTAQAEGNIDNRRRLLVQADTDLQEARQLVPDRPEAAELSDQVRQALDALDARTELTELRRIADLSTSGVGPQAVTRAAVGDLVYALDAPEGKVLGVPADGSGQPRVVFEAGRKVNGVETGKAALMAWVPANQGYLLIVDQNKRAFGLQNGQLRALTVRGSGQWSEPRAMHVANGALYVLDAGAGEIRRFTPTDNGFDSAPQTVVAGADLRRAVDFAVASDIFVLEQDGTVRRFAGGSETGFHVAGLEPPLASPSAMSLSAKNGHLYIADGGNQRIVVTGQDGKFRQQLVSTQITAINAAALNGNGTVIVVVVGQSLYASPVPEAPG